MQRKVLMEDAAAMEEILERTADRCDIWQDRFVYHMAKAIYHILLHLAKEERRAA